VTCSKSCRLSDALRLPPRRRRKTRSASRDYVFRAGRPRPARVRVPCHIAGKTPMPPCLRSPYLGTERHPSPASPAHKGLDINRDYLLAGWRGEVGLQARRGGRRDVLLSKRFLRVVTRTTLSTDGRGYDRLLPIGRVRYFHFVTCTIGRIVLNGDKAITRCAQRHHERRALPR
jgi:hypothetical protein